MMITRRLAVGAVVLLVTTSWALPAAAGTADTVRRSGAPDDSDVQRSVAGVVGATASGSGIDLAGLGIDMGQASVDTPAANTAPRFEYDGSDPCSLDGLSIGSLVSGLARCATEGVALGVPVCDEYTIDLARRRELAEGPDAAWQLAQLASCEAEGELPVMTAADFRRLDLAPSRLTVQPDRGWTLVNIETIAYTVPEVQVLHTELLGFAVTVRASLVEFGWDFGGGSPPWTTADPGAPYPDHTVGHTYEQVGEGAVTLTTTWAGEFAVDGLTGFQPIDGYATTVTTSDPFDVLEARSRLVDAPLTGG